MHDSQHQWISAGLFSDHEITEPSHHGTRPQNKMAGAIPRLGWFISRLEPRCLYRLSHRSIPIDKSVLRRAWNRNTSHLRLRSLNRHVMSSASQKTEAQAPADAEPEHQKRKRNPTETKSKKERKHVTRRGPENQPADDKPPHDGSYANEELRKMFGIQLPGDPPDDSTLPSKRKVAMLIAYTGSCYGGFQINAGQRTLQAAIELSLYKAHLLSQRNYGYPHKYGWSTSGRTDKGVHACAQVCSAKLCVGDGDLDDVRDRINAHLPSDISVLDVVRTSRNFCAKTQRDRVRYQYMFPSFVLMDRNELRRTFEQVLGTSPGKQGRSPSDPMTPEEISQLQQVLVSYRASPEQRQLLREALHEYVGTRPYHNFTKGITSADPSAFRYIISFECQEPIVRGKHNTEWIETQVVGQSFLLHQIRKMISMVVDVVRGAASPTVLQNALDASYRVRLNVAPSEGLFLDMSVFDGYNRRMTERKSDAPPLDWISDSSTLAAKRWKSFKEEVVMKHIVDEEDSFGKFVKYLFVQEYVFDAETCYQVQFDGQGTQPEVNDDAGGRATGDT